MPIRKHVTDKTAFGPAAIEAMSKAFEEACIALQVFAGDEKGREIIATRIIDLARNGLIDPTALRDRVIAEAIQHHPLGYLLDWFSSTQSTTQERLSY